MLLPFRYHVRPLTSRPFFSGAVTARRKPIAKAFYEGFSKRLIWINDQDFKHAANYLKGLMTHLKSARQNQVFAGLRMFLEFTTLIHHGFTKKKYHGK
jgi:hypothetical protein